MGNLTLWQQYKQGSIEAKNKLIENYSHIVKIIVGRICVGDKFGSLDRDDLYGSGIIGLIEAIDRYDMNHGVKFETYASTRIRGQIIDSIRKSNWIPKDIKASLNELEAAYNQLAIAELPMNDENLMEIMNLDAAKLRKIMGYASQSNLFYLDNFIQGDDEEERFIDTIADSTDTPLEELLKKQTSHYLSESIKKLSEKEQLVLSFYYYEELTFKEIATILNLSEARISQIHTKAIFRLRGFMNKFQRKSS